MREFPVGGPHLDANSVKSAEGAPLVSVVVPAYNLMGYIDHCLDSLLAQDFEAYEVVCVDDGSTDGTGELLDQYAETDSRVRVFHFRNEGLSVARNRGVSLARAKLISFVDGDDIVSPYYVGMLYAAHDGSPQTMVRASIVAVKPGDTDSQTWEEPCQARTTFNEYEMQREWLLGRLRVTAWGSLAHRSLYEDVPFVPGLVYEDIYAMPDHVARLSRMVVLGAKLYGVVRRPGSLSRPSEPSRRNGIHFCVATLHTVDVARQWRGVPHNLVEWRVASSYAALAVGGQSRKIPLLEELRNSLMAGAYARHRLLRLVSLWHHESLSTKRVTRMVFLALAPALYPAAVHTYQGIQHLWRDLDSSPWKGSKT